MNTYASPSSSCRRLEQVHDAGLDRHVERGDRLVEHDQLGLERERAGDADALALAAGELVRDSGCACSGERPTSRQQLARPRACASALLMLRWTRSGSRERVARSVMRGLSDAYGSWNTIWNRWRSVAQLASPSGARCRCPSNSHRARGRVGSGCSSSRPVVRLAAARLPDQPERLALRDVQADARRPPCTLRDRAGRARPPRSGNSFTRSVRPRARVSVCRAVVGGRRRSLERRPRLATSATSTSARSSAKWHAERVARSPSTDCELGLVGRARSRAAARTRSAGGTRTRAAPRSATAARP